MTMKSFTRFIEHIAVSQSLSYGDDFPKRLANLVIKASFSEFIYEAPLLW